MKLFSTSCESRYLGWDSPLLPAAVEELRKRGVGQRWDLGSLICVLPSARSTDRLRSLLCWVAEEHEFQLTLPSIITVGQLAEYLYQPTKTVAIEFEQTLAWSRVLRATDADRLLPLVPTLPAPEPIGPWLELAGTLRRLHEELASSRLSFADVIESAETDAEKRRWKLLSELFDDYLRSLDDADLADPHWSRREAVINNRCRTDRTVVLIGTSDLSDALVAMLRSLESELITMIAAPSSESFRFDEFGCVDTQGWIGHHLPLDDRHLISAGDVADQATAVAETLADYAERFSADQVTVGVTDESHVGPVEVELRGCGVSTYRQLGWTVSNTAVGRLFDLTTTYLQRRTWQSLAALVRHADVHTCLTNRLSESLGESSSSDWLTQLDQLLANHFPIRVRDPLPSQAAKNSAVAVAVAQWVEDWVSVFSGKDRPIASWSEVINGWLSRLYPDQPEQDNGRDRTGSALRAARRLVSRFAELNDQLDINVNGATAIEMLSGRLGDVRIVDTPVADDIEILGWLDLALDAAPAMVVMGLNHPFVPGAVTSDPFLPGSLRTQLRMADNDRRYARDLYAMHLLLSTRTAIRFVVGRSGADGSPTPPSRLIAASPTTDAARRVRSLLGGKRERVVVHHRWDDGPSVSRLPIPELQQPGAPPATIESMSVTAFRDYLACPYRFYLRHVLKMKPLDDASSELAANQFGDLVHGALERFGDSDDRDEPTAAKIESLLIQHLHDYTSEYFGDHVSTAVSLQVKQAEKRLEIVAQRQAERIAEGWKIFASEASVDEKSGAGIDIDGKRIGLRGRFDRVDHHQDSGRWAILDYKTHGHKPEKKHLQQTKEGHRWIDLQLPLYRIMTPFLGIDTDPSEVQLGYFNVSEKNEETKINIAEFTDSQMSQALELIHDCVRRIWAGDFEPTSDRVQFDDYDMILQTGVANRMLDQAEFVSGDEADT